MNRRELIAAMAAAVAAPAVTRAEGLLPPALEEMVTLVLTLTPEQQRMIEWAAFYDGVTTDEYVAGCLREFLVRAADASST